MPGHLPPFPPGRAGSGPARAGGLPPNRLYVVEGESGTGKTTIGLQFLMSGIRAGEKGLFLALSETEEELHSVAASHGWSLDGMALREVSAREGAPEENHTLFHPAEAEHGETTKTPIAETQPAQPPRAC